MLEAGRSRQAHAQLIQNAKSVHQMVLDGGSWRVAWQLCGLQDPPSRRRFAGSAYEQQICADWVRAEEIEKRSRSTLRGQMSDGDWKVYLNTEKATAYTVLGRSAAEQNSWNAAISNYQQVLNLSKEPAAKAEAYYYTGMGRWDQSQMDSAMDAFAKGSVQSDAPHAEHCRQHLETLYRSTHNDSLAGIDEFVARVAGR